MSNVEERVWELLDPYLAAEGVELDDLHVLGPGRGRLLRVTVDAPEGVDVDRIAELSRGMSRLLDDADPIPGSYRLEVSSPGLERKLRRPRHYAKAVGREVKVKTATPVDGSSLHQGVLGAADDDGFVLDMDHGPRRIAYRDVTSAQTVFTWERAAKPGGRRR